MDPKLAEIYGTNQVDETEQEKVAAAELVQSLADDGAVSMENLTEEQYEQLAQGVLGGDEEQETETEEEPEAGGEEEPAADDAQEKIAEADYLGRVMAHAYVNELKNIEKTAGVAGRVGKFLGQGAKDLGHMAKNPRAAASAAKESVKTQGLKKTLKANAGAATVAAGGAAAAGASGVAAKKAFGKKEKKASAMDTLVEARMHQILEASGIDPASLKPVEQPAEEEKVAGGEEALAAEVDRRAWEVLGQYGIVPAEQE